MVYTIVHNVRERGGRFLKMYAERGQWYELSDRDVKAKVAHALRDGVNAMEQKEKGQTKKKLGVSSSSPAPEPTIQPAVLPTAHRDDGSDHSSQSSSEIVATERPTAIAPGMMGSATTTGLMTADMRSATSSQFDMRHPPGAVAATAPKLERSMAFPLAAASLKRDDQEKDDFLRRIDSALGPLDDNYQDPLEGWLRR